MRNSVLQLISDESYDGGEVDGVSVTTQTQTQERPPTSEGDGQVTVLGRVAGHCYDHRRRVLVLWILAIVGMTVVAQVVGTHFQNKFTSGNTESQQAANLLSARFPSQAGDFAQVSSTPRRRSRTTVRRSSRW